MSRTFVLLLGALCLLKAAPAPADNVYRDPMRPYEASPEVGVRSEPVRWRLHTVLVSPERRVAVINGRICREGDRIDGALVVAIEREWVHLRIGAEDVTLAFVNRAPGEAQEEKEIAP